MLTVLFAEPFRSKKPLDFPKIANEVHKDRNRIRYHAQSAMHGMDCLGDRYYLPTYEEAKDIIKWAGVVIE